MTKLSVFDKQIDSKEEYERIRQHLESNDIVIKAMKEQLNLVNSKINTLRLSESRVSDIEKKFCDVHDIFVEEDRKVYQVVNAIK